MDRQGLIEPNSQFELTVSPEDAGTRLDLFLSKQFPLYSRSFFSKLIDNERVMLNTKSTKPSAQVKEGDSVSVHFPAPRAVQTRAIKEQDPAVKLLHKEDHFMILFKPARLVVHPTSAANTAITLVDWLLTYHHDIKDVGYVDRPGIIHRLDKDTSGLIIIPRTNYAHKLFGDLFRDRTIQKTYYAIVKGHPDKEGVIELPIGRDQATKTKMSTRGTHNMRDAKTNYKVLEYFDDASLLEVKPVTGRTHQIRVHLAAIGHPIIGDQVYGTKSKLIDRQALHAGKLGFTFDGTPHTFSADMPADMQKAVEQLRMKK